MYNYIGRRNNGKVSLNDILSGKDIQGISNLSFDDLISAMRKEGCPEALNISGDNKYKIANDYVKSLLSERIKTIDGIERNS